MPKSCRAVSRRALSDNTFDREIIALCTLAAAAGYRDGPVGGLRPRDHAGNVSRWREEWPKMLRMLHGPHRASWPQRWIVGRRDRCWCIVTDAQDKRACACDCDAIASAHHR